MLAGLFMTLRASHLQRLSGNSSYVKRQSDLSCLGQNRLVLPTK